MSETESRADLLIRDAATNPSSGALNEDGEARGPGRSAARRRWLRTLLVALALLLVVGFLAQKKILSLKAFADSIGEAELTKSTFKVQAIRDYASGDRATVDAVLWLRGRRADGEVFESYGDYELGLVRTLASALTS